MTNDDSKTLLDAVICAIETVLCAIETVLCAIETVLLSFTGLSTIRCVARGGDLGVYLGNEFGARTG